VTRVAKEIKRVEYEKRPGERFDLLRINVKVPKPSVPETTGKHVRGAQREMLLAIRTLVDELIERADRFVAGAKGEDD
jgi:hypothetical protein